MARKQKDVETPPQTAEATGDAPRSPREVERGILHVGVDLGTSRSAIACSNGVRECVGSLVGWPRDNVSSKVLGRRVLFGDEALEHRLSLDLVSPLARGNLVYPGLEGDEKARSRQAAEELVRHLRTLCRPRHDQIVYAVIGAPAQASTENKQALVEMARVAGLDSVMVVSEPFSVAYGIDALDEAIIIDIGAGTIDLCRMHGTLPEVEDQITIFKAGDHIDGELSRLIKKRYADAQFSRNMVKKAKERFSGVVDTSDRALVTFPVEGRPTELDVTEEIQAAVRSIVPEILQSVQKLVASFDPEFQHRIRNRVFVSGGGSQIYGLQKALEEGMEQIGGGNVFLVQEPVYAGANGALKLAREMPAEYWEQLN
ncbi:MAG: MamK family actin-like protein [Planctomycetota bacterium]